MNTTPAAGSAATQAKSERPAFSEALLSRGPVALIGGTGKTGRRVATRLGALGVDVRQHSRSTAVPFDWENPRTWPAALEGATAAYLSFQPDLAMPGACDTIGQVSSLAVDLGVERLVLLSGRGEPGAEASEQALLASGAEVSVVRCSWFAQNFSEGVLLESVLEGVIAVPVPADMPEPFIDANDIADVAVTALTREGLGGKVLELTGPSSLTFVEAAEQLSAASGLAVSYASVSAPEFIDGSVAAGVPATEAEFLADLFATVMDCRNRGTKSGVEDVLGRPARSFADFASAAAAAGAWTRGRSR